MGIIVPTPSYAELTAPMNRGRVLICTSRMSFAIPVKKYDDDNYIVGDNARNNALLAMSRRPTRKFVVFCSVQEKIRASFHVQIHSSSALTRDGHGKLGSK